MAEVDAIRRALASLDVTATNEQIEQLSRLTGSSYQLAQAFKNAEGDMARVNSELETLAERAAQGASSLDAMATAGRGALSAMVTAFNTAAQEGMEGVDETYKALGILGEEKIDMYTQLQATLGGDFRSQLGQFSEGAEELQFQVGGVIQTMYNDFYTKGYRQFFGSAEEFMGYASEIYLSVGSGLVAMQDLGDNASQQIEEAAMMARGLGFSSQEMMDMMDARMSFSGEFSTQILREVTAHSSLISQATGDSQKAIARGMYEMMTDVQTFGETTAATAAATVGNLRELGLEMRDLAAVTNKYLNFDSAAESLANLNTVFGMQLDTMAMMEAATRDPMEAMHMLRDAFLDSGRDFRSMTIQEQRLLAEQAGLEIEAAARLFDPTAQITSMEQLTDAAEEMEIPTGAEAVAELADEIARVPRLQGDFTDAVFNQIAMNDLAAVTDQAAQAQAAMTDFALGVTDVSVARNLLPESARAELDSTLEGLRTMTGEGGLLNTVTGQLGAVTGGAQRLPGDISRQLTGPEAVAAARRGGQEFGDSFVAGLSSRVSEYVPTIGRTGTTATQNLDDAEYEALRRAGLDESIPVDDVIIGSDGVFRTNPGDTIMAALELDEERENIAEIFSQIFSQTAGEALSEAPAAAAGNLSDLVDTISQGFEALRTGTGGTGTPGERSINLNLTLNLAGRRLAELKDMLITSPAVNGIDFEKTISD
jgi:ABC-type transporter Mla subunit MlaD